VLCLFTVSALADEPPATRRSAVNDVYHGVTVTDDYRWLEDWRDPAVRAWSDTQSAHARAHLDALPNVEAIRARVTELASDGVRFGSLAYEGGRVFAIKTEPPREQPFLVAATSPQDAASATVVVDPNAIDPQGLSAIDWYAPSPDGKLVAVSLSSRGTEAGDAHVFDVATGREVYEVVPGVNSGTAGGDLAWSADGEGFYYTRHFRVQTDNAADERYYQHVYYHVLGTPQASDRYELGQGFPEVAEIKLVVDRRTDRVLAWVQDGDGGKFAHFLRAPNGGWRQLSGFEDKIIQVSFGSQDDLFAVSIDNAPRGKLVRLPADGAGASYVVIPEGGDAIVAGGLSFYNQELTVLPTQNRLYLIYQLGGPSELRVFDYEGRRLEAPEQLPVSAVHWLVPLGGDAILFGNESYLRPSAFYRYDGAGGQTVRTSFANGAAAVFDDATVVRELATSKDGTRVPLNIIHRIGIERDAVNPTLVTGYGGFSLNTEPAFSAMTRLLLDHGVIYVQTNLRGGAEFGDDWHRAGSLTQKQNVFDDFAAVLEHLIARRYTTPQRLAIQGGSNGGLLMGATITQHPELVKAVTSAVGIYDMLRHELTPNGAFNVAEYGTVRDPVQFAALRAYSPYHNVRDGVRYPAILFLTGANDPRVDPMHSRKMTARLQAAGHPAVPILLRTSSTAGHGGDNALSEFVEWRVDMYAFLFDQLGIDASGSSSR
jgi:prolyl oligopeptidase